METVVVNDKELAEYFGVTDRRVRQMVDEKIAVRTKRGQYDLKASVINYIAFLKEQINKKDANLDKLKIAREAEGLTHDRLKKRKTELQVLSLEKKMHTSEDVEFFWNAMVLAAKSRITAIPVKCSPVLVGLEDRKEIQAILKREVDEALNELADYDIDKFESEYDDDVIDGED